MTIDAPWRAFLAAVQVAFGRVDLDDVRGVRPGFGVGGVPVGLVRRGRRVDRSDDDHDLRVGGAAARAPGTARPSAKSRLRAAAAAIGRTRTVLQMMVPAVRVPLTNADDPRPAGGMSPAQRPGAPRMRRWRLGPGAHGPFAGTAVRERSEGCGRGRRWAVRRRAGKCVGAPRPPTGRVSRGPGSPARRASGSTDRARTGSAGHRRSRRSAAATARRPPDRPRRSPARRCRRTRS